MDKAQENNVTLQNDFNHFSMNDDFDNIRMPIQPKTETVGLNFQNTTQSANQPCENNITMEDDYM